MLSPLSTAVIEVLRSKKRPVIINYDLFRLIWDIYEHPKNYPVKIIKRVSAPGYTQYRRVIMDLSKDRLIRSDSDFESYHSSADTRTHVFRISDVPDASAEDISCLVDPFAYVSHLSAMQRYGLTVRQPEILSLTTPKKNLWSQKRDEKMRSEYNFDPSAADLDYFRPLQQVSIPDIVRDRKTYVQHSIRNYKSINITDSFARIIEIGDLFVQMLDNPDLCGGMKHVIETWEEHSAIYLDQIIKAVDSSQTDIVKVRAGYILSDLLSIKDHRIEIWKSFAQRGGSRKLDPSKPYNELYSDEWMISLNV